MGLKVVSVREGVYRRYCGCIRDGILKKYVLPLTVHNIDKFIWKQLKFKTKFIGSPKYDVVYNKNDIVKKYNLDKNGNYIQHYPGFLKKPGKNGVCIPCCFSKRKSGP